ncbi:DUF983 domain-containing protein [Belliella marina]|uniref:DUF983 domain-containing protein n=1 Tax=Belliella marina TaxID=1644146 RepID=A0ABW4VGP4_9BACT
MENKGHQKSNRSGLVFQGIEKGNLWLSMESCKCPICTKGDMFKSSATDLKKFNELNESCSNCGFKFMPEPGFYQISMFLTYAFSVALFVIFGFLTYLIFDNPPLWVYYAMIFIPAIITVPWSLRYSKVIMLYIFTWKK